MPLAMPSDRCAYPTVSCTCVVPAMRRPPVGGGRGGRGMGAGGAAMGAGGMGAGTASGMLQCQPVRTPPGGMGGMGGMGGRGGRGGMGAGGTAAGGMGAGGMGAGQCGAKPPQNGGACTGTETCPLPNMHACTCTANKWACK
jgi:hypothetical protein